MTIQSITEQKARFLHDEGDAWFNRNHSAQDAKVLPDSDRVLMQILELPSLGEGTKVLEIGCGQGRRLAWLQENLGFSCAGIEPSAKAVQWAQAAGISARQGTADQLPFEGGVFDLVIFGFCLYLCDPADLFRIASEADRVLKSPGWLIINDFFVKAPMRREYHHAPGLYSHKMDYRTLFTWHPSYTCYNHDVRHHGEVSYTDDPQEWVAISLLRKDAGRYPEWTV